MSVKFNDYSVQVIDKMNDRINAKLEECAGEIESATKRNTRVDSGDTKNNWDHYVDEGEHIAYIGNPLENAIWEEFGTGEHALQGNGRKGGWKYVDDEGKGHFTYGKKPSRAFHKAYTSLKNKVIRVLENALKGM